MKSYIESQLIQPLISHPGHLNSTHHTDELSNTFIYFVVCRGKPNHSPSKPYRTWKLFWKISHLMDKETWGKSTHSFKVRQWINGTVGIRNWHSCPPGQYLWTRGQHPEKRPGNCSYLQLWVSGFGQGVHTRSHQSHHLRGLSSPFFQEIAWEQQGSKSFLADKRY